MDYRADVQPDSSRKLKLYKRIVPNVRYKRYPFIVGIKNGSSSSVLKELERATGIQNLTYESHKVANKRYYEELPYENIIKRVPLPPAYEFEPRPWIEYVAFKSLEVAKVGHCIDIWGLKTYPNEAINVLSHMIINSDFLTKSHNTSYSNDFTNTVLEGYSIDHVKCALLASFFLECKCHICGIEKFLNDVLDVIDSRFTSGSFWNISGKANLSKPEIFSELNTSPVVWHWLFQYIRRFASETTLNLFVKKSKLSKSINCWNINLMYFIEIAIRRPLDNGRYNIAYSAIDYFSRNAFYPNNGKQIKPGKSLTPKNIYMLASLANLSNPNYNREIMNSILAIVDTIDTVDFEFEDINYANILNNFSGIPIGIATFAIVDSILTFNNNLSLLLLIALLISTNIQNKNVWKKLLSVCVSDKTAKKVFKTKFVAEDHEMWITYARNPHTPYLKRRMVFKNHKKIPSDASFPFTIIDGGKLLDIVKYFKNTIKEFTPTPWCNHKISHLLNELLKRWERTCSDDISLTFPFLEIVKSSIGQADENITLSLFKYCSLDSSNSDLFNSISKSHRETQLTLFHCLLASGSEEDLLKKVDEIINYGIHTDVDVLLQKIASLGIN